MAGEEEGDPEWQLVWADEFDGATLDPARWSVQTGDGCSQDLCGWGNNELQWYQADNVDVADGVLTITARQEAAGGRTFTSARIRTRGKGDWKYGRFEISARLPEGQGLWPAIWMLPTDEAYGEWAASGEIDIMELVGHEPARVHGTLHYGGPWPANRYSGDHFDLASGDFSDDFHVFALEWEEGEIRWYVDGVHYQTQTEWSSTGGPYPAPFDRPFHLVLNVAVGGDWPGSPDATTSFPQRMQVDYVRVLRRP
jgi:beta-glucanase (GH16 family)